MVVNTEAYTKNSLPKKHHKDEDIVFWPDLASCNYAKATLDWLTAHDTPFVRKEDIPPAATNRVLWGHTVPVGVRKWLGIHHSSTTQQPYHQLCQKKDPKVV